MLLPIRTTTDFADFADGFIRMIRVIRGQKCFDHFSLTAARARRCSVADGFHRWRIEFAG
jgi:hypothetical protein